MISEASATWFGPQERPLLGWVHRPRRPDVRGAVVLCPSVGVELAYGHLALRALAGRLQALGLIAIRFDYDGTGHSSGETNAAGCVQRWRDSIDHAAELARAEGARWVAGVGFRLGATLLAGQAARTGEFDAVVLWDPCLSGKSFLREQALLALALPTAASDDGGVEISGYRLSAPTASELREVELPSARTPIAPATLVLTDPDRGPNARLARRLAGAEVQWQQYAATGPVLDTGEPDYVLPEACLEQIASWTQAHAADEPPVTASPQPARRRAIVGRGRGNRPIFEQLLRLGPTGLFGISCELERSPSSPGADAPTVLFVSMAAEPSIGPGRQWVEISRAWAAAGYRAVRFDLSGIGESPTRVGRPSRHIYAPCALDDIAEAAAAVSPEDPSDVVLVGVCSGAYSALAVGPHMRPRGIIAINPVLTVAAFDGWAPAPAPDPSTAAEDTGSRQALAHPAHRRAIGHVVRRLSAFGRGSEVRPRIAATLPPWVWSIAYAAGLSHSPSTLIDPLVRVGVPTLLLCGAHEAEAPRTRRPRAFRRLDTADGSEFRVIPDLDHSLRNERSRVAARFAMEAFLSVTGAPERVQPARPEAAPSTAASPATA